MITELFYSHIINMNRRSLYTRRFWRIHLSVSRYRLIEHGFSGPKRFRGFRETGPWLESGHCVLIFFSHCLSSPCCMYGLLTKCEVRMAGKWPSSFSACLWTETKSRSINTQTKGRGQYPAILTE